jgi:hypothetical protein
MRMIRDRLENLGRLLGGQVRVALEQAYRMGEGGFDRSDRFCGSAPTHVTMLPRSSADRFNALSVVELL